MAKPTRATRTRSSKPAREKSTARARGTSASPAAAPPQSRPREENPLGPPAKKPAYYEAIAIYEAGVRALQRRDYAVAADHFRSVIQRFADERELLERARLYLQVCERETANRPSGPRTPQERIYAATVALNAGDPDGALTHLKRALAEDSGNEHGHYIMAVALSERGQLRDAIEHLRKSIELNPENRSLARQDPDLSVLRETDGCRALLDPSGPFGRRRPRSRY